MVVDECLKLTTGPGAFGLPVRRGSEKHALQWAGNSVTFSEPFGLPHRLLAPTQYNVPNLHEKKVCLYTLRLGSRQPQQSLCAAVGKRPR